MRMFLSMSLKGCYPQGAFLEECRRSSKLHVDGILHYNGKGQLRQVSCMQATKLEGSRVDFVHQLAE